MDCWIIIDVSVCFRLMGQVGYQYSKNRLIQAYLQAHPCALDHCLHHPIPQPIPPFSYFSISNSFYSSGALHLGNFSKHPVAWKYHCDLLETLGTDLDYHFLRYYLNCPSLLD